MPASVLDQSYYAYLAERIRRGDGDAFTELYTRTYPRLHRYVSLFLKNEDLVPDVLQEIYITVYKGISSLKMDRLLIPWMKQIAYHACCDFAAGQRRQAAVMVNVDSSVLESLSAPASGADPFQTVYDRDLAERLEQALAELPVHESAAFRLRYLQDLQLEEIAELMDTSLASVKRYLQRARAALRQRLAHLRPDGAAGGE